jgi:N-acetylmuramoyl-L-alanine amidase
MEKRQALIEDSDADLFVELSVEGDDDTAYNGLTSYYNDKFFLRRLSNAGFADILLKGCASKGAGEALGVFVENEESLLDKCAVPAARISLGNVFGAQDGERLGSEVYQTRVAEGIYQGILDAIEVME